MAVGLRTTLCGGPSEGIFRSHKLRDISAKENRPIGTAFLLYFLLVLDFHHHVDTCLMTAALPHKMFHFVGAPLDFNRFAANQSPANQRRHSYRRRSSRAAYKKPCRSAGFFINLMLTYSQFPSSCRRVSDDGRPRRRYSGMYRPA